MATATVVTLPEIWQDLPYSNSDDWLCPNCDNSAYYESWSTVNVYDVDSAQQYFAEMSAGERMVGEEENWTHVLRAKVFENEMQQCPSCDGIYEADDLAPGTDWNCSKCGERWDNSHAALTCCMGDACPEECPCFDGVPRDSQDHPLPHVLTTAIGATMICFCAGGDRCGYAVCLVCHAQFSTADLHSREHHPCKLSDYHLPERPECMCGTGFCCTLHDLHTHPHLGCDLES